MKQTKKIMALLLMTILVAGAVMMNGCSLKQKPSRVDTAKAALADKYGEEFNVRIDESYSSVFYATCSPVNNPEVVFEARFSDSTGVTNINQDDYYERYTASLINEKDLQKFFPGAYFKTNVTCATEQIEQYSSIRNRSLEEMMNNKPEGYVGNMYLYIYVDTSVGTTKQYEAEYLYFTETVDKYIEENKMRPVTVSITKVNTSDMAYIEEYFKENTIQGSDFNAELGISPGKDSLYNYESINPGNPPEMSACFEETKNNIGSVEEYIRRREIWEDAK